MNRLHEIAIGCVPLLEGNWRYLKNEAWTGYRQRAVLKDDDKQGRKIIFSDYYKGEGRLQITGSFPDKHYRHLKITLAMSRAIPDLSADINRRFLPEYLKNWNKAEEIYQSQLLSIENLRIRADLLKQITPSMRPSWTHTGDVATEYYLENGKIRLSPYSDEANLDIKLSFEELVKVLHLLKQN